MNLTVAEQASKKTKVALLLSGLLNEPLLGFLAILPFILRKDLHASDLQIALFTMVKPVVALFSFYWGASLWRKQEKLRANWVSAFILARLPFLLFPFIDSIPFFIFSAAIFHFFQRGSVPAQMEILKQNVPQGIRETVFTWSAALNFLFSIGIGLALGFVMDSGIDRWKNLFFWGGFTGLLSVILQARVPVQPPETVLEETQNSPLLTPWKDSLALLKRRPDFARFQIGFMFGGIGLMLMMPALVLYAADDLKITHIDMTLSRFVWMGLGFVLATPFWRKNMTLQKIYGKTAAANFLFTLAILAWILATSQPWWFFVAYFLYGVAQAGSHLSWHLSGPLFAGSSESSLFSTVNILTVGLRGLLIPGLSTLLCRHIGSFAVLWIGLFFCLAGAIYLVLQRAGVEVVEC